jgi:3-dehydroquinate dehydratase
MFLGADGSSWAAGAYIEAFVDGATSAGDLPTRLVFSTCADGASSPTERMRINNLGALKATTTGSVITSASSTHEFTNGNASEEYAVRIRQSSASGNLYPLLVEMSAQAPNNATSVFINCGDSGTTRLALRSNGGLANYSANNVNLSDINTKKDISPAADTWDCLKQWEIVNFRYKDQPDNADLNMGVIAQQVAESCPEVITVFQEAKEATDTEPAQEERLGVKDQQMMWMAIKALQEAQIRIENLEAEVAALKGA